MRPDHVGRFSTEPFARHQRSEKALVGTLARSVIGAIFRARRDESGRSRKRRESAGCFDADK
jgi:hypothetical protein